MRAHLDYAATSNGSGRACTCRKSTFMAISLLAYLQQLLHLREGLPVGVIAIQLVGALRLPPRLHVPSVESQHGTYVISCQQLDT